MNTTASSRAGLFSGGSSTRFLTFLLAAAFFASAHRAAAQITYTVFQATGPDIVNTGSTDTISGTITVSGTGVDPTIVSYNFTLSSNDPAVSSVSANSATPSEPAPQLVSGSLTATPTALILSSNGDLLIQAGGVTAGNPYVSAEWEPADNALNIFAGDQGDPATIHMFNTSASTTSGLGAPPWTIATAIPEPRSEALLLLGAPALLLLRRKRKPAVAVARRI